MNVEYLKIKAKRKDNGEWVEGYYVYNRLKKKHLILTDDYKVLAEATIYDDAVLEFKGFYEINPETICRLWIKDSKREWWEGDILRDKETNRLFRVEYSKQFYCFLFKSIDEALTILIAQKVVYFEEFLDRFEKIRGRK